VDEVIATTQPPRLLIESGWAPLYHTVGDVEVCMSGVMAWIYIRGTEWHEMFRWLKSSPRWLQSLLEIITGRHPALFLYASPTPRRITRESYLPLPYSSSSFSLSAWMALPSPPLPSSYSSRYSSRTWPPDFPLPYCLPS